jgi:uncharacterized protein YPO0396
LADVKGSGQRLVYLCVGERKASSVSPVGHRQSLLRKLAFREGHALTPWVRGELEERVDFRCCDTLAEFQEAPGLALLECEIEGGQQAIASAQSQIRRDKANGTFARHAKSFSQLEACFADASLTAAPLVERS